MGWDDRALGSVRRRGRPTLVLIWLLIGATLAGCGTNERTGALVGAIAGAALGVGTAVLTGNAKSGAALGGLIGAGVGALIGSAIGADLDEVERQKALAAAQSAAEQPEGSQVTWKSDTHPDVGGYASPIAPEEYQAGTACRRVREVVFTADGEKTAETQLCRKDGQWQPT